MTPDDVEVPDVFDRIVCNPAILGGKPTVKGTRISVQIIPEWFAGGATAALITESHPHLTPDDIHQALMCAAASMGIEPGRPACAAAPEPGAVRRNPDREGGFAGPRDALATASS